MGLEDLKPYEQISAEDVRRLAEDVSRNRRGRGQGYGIDSGGLNFVSGKMEVPEEDDWFIAELISSSSPYAFKEKWYEGTSPVITDRLNGRIGDGIYNPLYLLAGATGTSGDIILATRMPGNKDNYVGLSLKGTSLPTVVTDICVQKEGCFGDTITDIYVTKSDGSCAKASTCDGCSQNICPTQCGTSANLASTIYVTLANATITSGTALYVVNGTIATTWTGTKYLGTYSFTATDGTSITLQVGVNITCGSGATPVTIGAYLLVLGTSSNQFCCSSVLAGWTADWACPSMLTGTGGVTVAHKDYACTAIRFGSTPIKLANVKLVAVGNTSVTNTVDFYIND